MTLLWRMLVSPICLLLSASIVLAGCSSTRVTLSPVAAAADAGGLGGADRPAGAVLTSPRPQYQQRTLERNLDIDNAEGWVRLRFSVAESGELRGIKVLESDNRALEATAVRLLAEWPHEAGKIDGRPAPFEGLEAFLTFSEVSGLSGTPEQDYMIMGIIVGTLAAIIVVALTTDANFVTND